MEGTLGSTRCVQFLSCGRSVLLLPLKHSVFGIGGRLDIVVIAGSHSHRASVAVGTFFICVCRQDVSDVSLCLCVHVSLWRKAMPIFCNILHLQTSRSCLKYWPRTRRENLNDRSAVDADDAADAEKLLYTAPFCIDCHSRQLIPQC